MKYSISTLALLTAPFATAGALFERGALTELPNCAQDATEAGISATSCEISDFACICGNSQFVTSLHSLIETDCSAADQQITLAFAEQVCKSVGVSLNIPTASETASSGVPASTAASSVPSAVDNTASVTSSGISYPTPSPPPPPHAFANGTTSINGTNTTIPFTGAAAERNNKSLGFQLAATSALSVALVIGLFL